MVWLLGILLVAVMFVSAMVGLFVQPFAPFWFGQRTAPVVVTRDGSNSKPELIDVPQIAHGFVSDRQRYLLARAAGWTFQEAITAVAISIAEDGSGDPAALSGVNFNGTRDLGLWQINSAHWPSFGGAAALIEPFTNARAAFSIWGPLHNWCAWSTFERGCGPGHTGAYVAFLSRARTAAEQ